MANRPSHFRRFLASLWCIALPQSLRRAAHLTTPIEIDLTSMFAQYTFPVGSRPHQGQIPYEMIPHGNAELYYRAYITTNPDSSRTGIAGFYVTAAGLAKCYISLDMRELPPDGSVIRKQARDSVPNLQGEVSSIKFNLRSTTSTLEVNGDVIWGIYYYIYPYRTYPNYIQWKRTTIANRAGCENSRRQNVARSCKTELANSPCIVLPNSPISMN
jgi:hypothetical protein